MNISACTDGHELFSQLLGPISPSEFAYEYWARKPLLVKGAIPSAQLNPLDPRHEVGRFLLDEHLLLLLEAQVRKSAGGRQPLVEPPDALAFLQSGEHIQLRKLQKVLAANHPIVQMAHSFEDFLGHPLDSITTIISPPDSQMISEHFDLTEIFTIQIFGTKVWSIYSHDGQTCAEYMLEPGDLLYVPARTVHKVLSTGTIAISYALIYRAVRLDSVLAELARDILKHDGRNAATLPVMGSLPQDPTLLRSYHDFLIQWRRALNDIEVPVLLYAAKQLSLLLTSPEPSDLFAEWESATLESTFTVSPRLNATVDYRDGHVQVFLAGGSAIEIPGEVVVEVGKTLGNTDVFTADQIATIIHPSEVLSLFRAFARAGLIHLCTNHRSRNVAPTYRVRGSTWSPRFFAHFIKRYAAVDSTFCQRFASSPLAALQEMCSEESLIRATLIEYERMADSDIKRSSISPRPFTAEHIRINKPEEYER